MEQIENAASPAPVHGIVTMPFTPYYDCDGITIYHGDSRKIMPWIERCDLLLTDPPYGIGDRMQGGTWGAKEKYADFRAWDEAPKSYSIEHMVDVANISMIWGGNYYGLPASRCWLVWRKVNAVPTMAGAELAWTNMDKPCKAIDPNDPVPISSQPLVPADDAITPTTNGGSPPPPIENAPPAGAGGGAPPPNDPVPPAGSSINPPDDPISFASGTAQPRTPNGEADSVNALVFGVGS